MRVKEIMVHPVKIINENATLEEAAHVMLELHIGCLPVVNDQGDLVGIITKEDFIAKERPLPFSLYWAPKLFDEWISKDGVERIYEAARTRSVNSIMSSPVVTATEDEKVTAVVEKMVAQEFHHMPVVRGTKPVGIVTRHDLLKLMARRGFWTKRL